MTTDLSKGNAEPIAVPVTSPDGRECHPLRNKALAEEQKRQLAAEKAERDRTAELAASRKVAGHD